MGIREKQAPVYVNLSGASAIDWDTGEIYFDTITSYRNFTFNYNADGKIITLMLQNTTGSDVYVQFPNGIYWPGGFTGNYSMYGVGYGPPWACTGLLVSANTKTLWTFQQANGIIFGSSLRGFA